MHNVVSKCKDLNSKIFKSLTPVIPGLLPSSTMSVLGNGSIETVFYIESDERPTEISNEVLDTISKVSKEISEYIQMNVHTTLYFDKIVIVLGGNPLIQVMSHVPVRPESSATSPTEVSGYTANCTDHKYACPERPDNIPASAAYDPVTGNWCWVEDSTGGSIRYMQTGPISWMQAHLGKSYSEACKY